jgi:hypothetical protein
MPASHTDLEKRVWDAADELRANSKLKIVRIPCSTSASMSRNALLCEHFASFPCFIVVARV